MDTTTYFKIYNTLLERNIDTDEARCMMSDIEDAVAEGLDAWEYLEDIM